LLKVVILAIHFHCCSIFLNGERGRQREIEREGNTCFKRYFLIQLIVALLSLEAPMIVLSVV
jgi:hypothetical protein